MPNMTMKKTPLLLSCCALLALLASCGGVQYPPAADGDPDGLLALPAPAYPEARFAVISDPHLYDPRLGTEGEAFQKDMLYGRKLLSAGPELLAAALQRVEETGARFLLIPGDLTKDGERQSHLLMAERLSAIQARGIRVFVVPGNHDILNPQAASYDGNGETPVAHVTPAEFADIYSDFGYGDALYRDPGSLGYVAEPVPGLWLLAVDSANYAGNVRRGRYETGPGLTTERVAWIRSMLAEALRQGKAVVCMQHHGAMEHYAGNDAYYPQYIVNGWKDYSAMLAAYHARVVFTGHFHSQDVTLRRDADGRFLYDVETGSLATFPDPVRAVGIGADQRMTVASSFITSLPSYAEKGVDFWKYAEEFAARSTLTVGSETLRKLGVSRKDTDVLAPQVSEAVMANLRGDERFTGATMLGAARLGLMGGLVVSLRKGQIAGFWNDLPPADNDLVIDLSNGEWSPAE
jgi:3',5'-cyclic AMP phosphodiesterase CpdA